MIGLKLLVLVANRFCLNRYIRIHAAMVFWIIYCAFSKAMMRKLNVELQLGILWLALKYMHILLFLYYKSRIFRDIFWLSSWKNFKSRFLKSETPLLSNDLSSISPVCNCALRIFCNCNNRSFTTSRNFAEASWLKPTSYFKDKRNLKGGSLRQKKGIF